MNILDGKQTAATLNEQIAVKVQERKAKNLKIPHLAAIIVGDDPASHTYVSHKIKACEKVGFYSSIRKLDASTTEEKLLDEIKAMNNNPEVDGFIVQLPLPPHIDVNKVIESVAFQKDVDGFHPTNIGRMMKGLPALLPATPAGILKLIAHYQIETKGKHCVVIGRSQIVGTPMSLLLSKPGYPGDCTVTLCHRHTKDLSFISRQADILISAVGQPGLVTGEMVKPGAVVIDVGTTRVIDKNKKSGFALKGDVVFDEVAPHAQFITPVPGGVGPMTIHALIANTLLAAERNDALPKNV